MAETKSDGFTTWIGASCMEEPPIWISGVTALEDETTGLVLGAISTVKSLLKVVKM